MKKTSQSANRLFLRIFACGLVTQILILLYSGYFILHHTKYTATLCQTLPFLNTNKPLVTSSTEQQGRLIQNESERVLQTVVHVNLEHPLAGMIQHHFNGYHDPTQQRNCFTFTAVPKEMDKLLTSVEALLQLDHYATVLDCIHINVPHRALRFSQESYPTTQQLQQRLKDPRIIFNRLPDYGPMTRYIGPLAFEKHPETSLILFDIDSPSMSISSPLLPDQKDLLLLTFASRHIDTSAVWCFQGEDFVVEGSHVRSVWDTFHDQVWYDRTNELQFEWNECHFCRGVGGLLFKPKHFVDFWYNQSEYHESCFWDDDRWVSYQMERQKFPLKVVHPPSTVSPVAGKKAPPFVLNVSLLQSTKKQPNVAKEENVTREMPHRHLKVAPSQQFLVYQSHRRLGSLTQITNNLKSDQTCPLAWLAKHPEAYPTARAINYNKEHPRSQRRMES